MFGRRRPETSRTGGETATEGVTPGDLGEQPSLLDVAYPMQQVRIRWHTLDGGEVVIPGQLQSIDGEMIEVWFDRNAPAFDPVRACTDDQIWIDAPSGIHTYVFSAWLIGRRPPDTLVIMVNGLPRRDQRRQYVRESVDLPAQTVVPVDAEGEPIGSMQLAKVHDLSGGGVKFELHEPVAKGTLLMITLELGDISFDAVVTVIDAFQTISGRQIVRGAFSEISERFRRDVIRYIFSEQLRRARLTPS